MDVVVCGFDIVLLKYVINYELFYVVEDYVYCIGCIGCVGEKGVVMLLVSIDE